MSCCVCVWDDASLLYQAILSQLQNLDGACIQSVNLVIDEDPRTEITLSHVGEVFMAGQYRISLPYSDGTVTPSSFIIFQHCSRPGWDGFSDSCAIEWKSSRCFTGLELALCWKKDLPSEYYSLFTPVFSWLRHSVDRVGSFLCVLCWTVWEWSDILVPWGIKTTLILCSVLCTLHSVSQSFYVEPFMYNWNTKCLQ